MISERRVLRRHLLRTLLGSRGRGKLAIDTTTELPTLWYENEEGDRHIPDMTDAYAPIPEGFIYQWSRFPRTLTENVLRLISQDEVDECPHPETRTDHGLIKGLEGHICNHCGGSQVRKIGEDWPQAWNAPGSRPYFTTSSSWPTSLVLAMTRPSPEEIAKAQERGHTIKPIDFEQAILFAATSCKRCLNVLLWRHGCDDGYEEGSPDWQRSNTSCEFCK